MKICINDDKFITDNSLECESGCYFLKSLSNEKFAQDALKKGATIINTKQAKDILSIKNEIKIIGITGTNGKTTTANAIYQTLLNLGINCGLSGTRGAFINGKRVDEKSLTTSALLKTLEYLSLASKSDCDYFVMEVSSHAIAQNRIEGLDFYLKVFTNLSQDHLDYHKTMQEYARTKSSFLSDDTLKLINLDDEFISFNPKNSFGYSIKKQSEFMPINFSLKNGIKTTLSTPKGKVDISSKLQGEFNLYNLTAAFGAVSLTTKLEPNDIANALCKFSGVEGRMQVVNQNPLVIVDFAHTPDGIEKVLNALRHLSLVVVFGAGGDRDRTKRPKMGAIAQKYARLCIVTSDNPRSENPQSIIDEIVQGMQNKNILCEVDRKEAIRLGLLNLKDNEALIILGKGDEDYQEIDGVKYPFSDKTIVQELLSKF